MSRWRRGIPWLAVACWLLGAPIAAARAQAAGAPEDGAGAAEPTASPASNPHSGVMADAESELGKARNLFAYGDYQAAVTLLTELVMPGRLASREDLIETHSMLGIALYQLDRMPEAKREFMELLYLDPDHRLDPFLTPPPVVEFFDRVRAEIADQLEVRRAQQRTPTATEPADQVPLVERTLRRRHWSVALVPFGYPQFERGDPVRGAIFVGAQCLALAANLATGLGAIALLDARGRVASVEDRELYQLLRLLSYAALGVAAAAYAGGVGEALIAFEPVTLEAEQTRTIPQTEVPAFSRAQGEE